MIEGAVRLGGSPLLVCYAVASWRRGEVTSPLQMDRVIADMQTGAYFFFTGCGLSGVRDGSSGRDSGKGLDGSIT